MVWFLVSFYGFCNRVLGGLLSAYDLSEDSMFLDKAKDLADRLLPAWNSPSGIPYTTINLQSGRAYNPGWTGVCRLVPNVQQICHVESKSSMVFLFWSGIKCTGRFRDWTGGTDWPLTANRKPYIHGKGGLIWVLDPFCSWERVCNQHILHHSILKEPLLACRGRYIIGCSLFLA